MKTIMVQSSVMVAESKTAVLFYAKTFQLHFPSKRKTSFREEKVTYWTVLAGKPTTIIIIIKIIFKKNTR